MYQNARGKLLRQRVQRHINGSNEYWRDVPGYGGYYRVSDCGRVKSVTRRVVYIDGRVRVHEGKLLTTSVERGGHLFVGLWKRNSFKHHYVHHLVLAAFVGKCPQGFECRHLNGRPDDNWLGNICWGTSKENAQDRVRHGTALQGVRNPSAKVDDVAVKEIRRLWTTGEYLQRELADLFGLEQTSISAIVRNKAWSHVK